MHQNETKLALVKKLHAILSEIQNIPKRGWNHIHNYYYHRESDVTEHLRGALVKHGVFIITNITGLTHECNQGASKNEVITRITTKHIIIDVDSGEKLECDFVGEGIDSRDKGAYKAITGAVKYFIMKTFHIGTDDDVEREDGINQAQTNLLKKTIHHESNQSKDLNSYVIPFGKWKGKRLEDIGTSMLSAYKTYLVNTAAEDKKPIQGIVKEFIDRVDCFVLGETREKKRTEVKGDVKEIITKQHENGVPF